MLIFPLYWHLTYCFSHFSHFFLLWSHFVIVFLESNVTLTHLLPSEKNPIFADTLPASVSVNMFSKSFFFLSANERFVIRLIILIHLHGIKPSCTNNHIFRSPMFPVCAVYEPSVTIFSTYEADQTWCIWQSWMVMFFPNLQGLWHKSDYCLIKEPFCISCPNLSGLQTT